MLYTASNAPTPAWHDLHLHNGIAFKDESMYYIESYSLSHMAADGSSLLPCPSALFRKLPVYLHRLLLLTRTLAVVSPSPAQIVKMTSQSVKTARMVAPSSNDAQDTFLEGIGMVATDVGPLEKSSPKRSRDY